METVHLKDYQVSDSVRQKMSNAHVGKKHSQETKEKIRNGLQKFWNSIPREQTKSEREKSLSNELFSSNPTNPYK